MEKDINLIFETSYWSVILMAEQLYLGRSVVVLKRACGDLAEVTEEEMLDFLNVVKKTEDLFRKTFGATMFNWACLMNDAYKVVPAEPQVHWHVRPRYSEKSFTLGEEIFEDPNFGHHYLTGDLGKKLVSQDILSLINQKIQVNI